MRFDDVSIGDDVPELLRGLDPEGAGEAAFCGGTAGLTNRSCDILIKERDIPPDIPCLFCSYENVSTMTLRDVSSA